mmetsp:Transcript_24539/g.27969  ORF Transcript_24539/g.27969 Transcript_24539/m.27969 type:complete len:373 (+) Transcript_24539:112-1230(+)
MSNIKANLSPELTSTNKGKIPLSSIDILNKNIDGDKKDDNAVVRVNPSPPPANQFVEHLVNMLVVEENRDDSPSAKTTSATGLHVLEVLSKMRLKKEENHDLRNAFKDTDLSKNLCELLKQEQTEEEVVRKIIVLIVTLTFKDDGHFKERFVSNDCLMILMQKMNDFSRNEKLQEAACTTLNNISIYIKRNDIPNATKKRFLDAINNTASMKTFHDTMMNYPKNKCVQESIFAVVQAFLSVNDSNNNRIFMQDVLIQVGFLDLICTFLENDLNDQDDNEIKTTASLNAFVKMPLLLLKIVAQEEKQARIVLREKNAIMMLAAIINRYHASSLPSSTLQQTTASTGGKTMTDKILHLALETVKVLYDNNENNE